MDDKAFYKLLNVSKRCTDDELKKAYYRAAKKYHPDYSRSPDTERIFADISVTYKRILEQRSKRFSLKNIFTSDNVSASEAPKEEPQSQTQTKPPERGSDIHMSLNLRLKESILGCKKRIHIFRMTRCSCTKTTGEAYENCLMCFGTGKHKKEVNIEITIPQNVKDGQTLTIKKKGNAGDVGAADGDLIIHVTILPDKQFFLKDNDIYVKKILTYPEAALGITVTVPTIYGDETITIHSGVKSRTKIRIPGKGIRTGDIIGDEYVVVFVDVPRIDGTNEELVELLGRLQKMVYDKELPNSCIK